MASLQGTDVQNVLSSNKKVKKNENSKENDLFLNMTKESIKSTIKFFEESVLLIKFD
jgi:hypothetical protein